MNRISLTTPENIEVEYKLADLGSRTGAVIIDLMIQGLIFFFIFAAVMLVSVFYPGLWEAHFSWITGISLFISAVIVYGYYIVMELKMNGRTPGKKILNIRTIRKNGQPITLKHSAIRNLFRIFIDMPGLGPLFIFFTTEHRRIGDFAASTIVVIEEKESQPIALETDQETADRVKNYVSEEEYELIRAYRQRKDKLQNPFILKNRLKDYFESKYQDIKILTEIEQGIDDK